MGHAQQLYDLTIRSAVQLCHELVCPFKSLCATSLLACSSPQRLSDIISYTLKKRQLHQAPGITGAEGYDCDDWMIVDCWNLIVHVFEADYRKVSLQSCFFGINGM